MQKEIENVRMLSIFYYVVAGLAALFACIPFIHLILGVAMILSPESFSDTPGDKPPVWLGWLFAGIGGGLILMGWAYAIALAFTGKFLGAHRRHTFCMVMGALSCLFMPFGTILGIFTLIVLSKPEVKELFQHN